MCKATVEFHESSEEVIVKSKENILNLTNKYPITLISIIYIQCFECVALYIRFAHEIIMRVSELYCACIAYNKINRLFNVH